MCAPNNTVSRTGASKKQASKPFSLITIVSRPLRRLGAVVSSALRDAALTANCVICVPMYSMAFWMTVYGATCIYAPNVYVRTAALSYMPICILLDGRPTASKSWIGYRFIETCRNCWLFRGVAQYFPVHLHRTDKRKTIQAHSSSGNDAVDSNKATAAIDTKSSTSSFSKDKNYIFLYHPHGVISMGANAALMTNGCQFSQVFCPETEVPKRYGVTLNVTFWAPIFREWLLSLGYISCNKSTLVARLRQPGVSIVLVPGGAAEALYAHRSNFRLHIKNRKGFVKLAMETKASLVPCLGFGENESFETYFPAADQNEASPASSKTSFWSRLVPVQSLFEWQQRLCKLLSFSLPIVTKILPNRRPIHVVVGEPVEFQPGASLEECHAQYLDALQKLYDNEKAKYGYQHIPLEFV